MRFGTDGVRGVANAELTPEFTLALGRAAARVLGTGRFLIGRDTRRSGPFIEAALAAGICAEGVDVELLGVLPTPAVAWVSALDHTPAAMISASHNPFGDNGIKLFAAGGLKLADDAQAEVEAEIARVTSGASGDVPTGAAVGVIRHVEGRSTERYEAAVLATLEGRRLDGLRVVLDCAHGAASVVAADVFTRAGGDITLIHAEPDGININEDSGSTDPAVLATKVVETGADVGFAFDGDADRVLAVDASGRLIDGDQLIAIAAIDLKARELLRGNTVVVTVMSNLGFRIGMQRAGIDVIDTQVGDRYVLEALDLGRFSLGGEQSGHLIFRDRVTTGDGLLSAVTIADVMVRHGRPLAELADDAMTRLPQVLRNVELRARPHDMVERLAPDIAAVEAELGTAGRVLVRPSGTEPLVRVMVEATDATVAATLADRLVDRIGELVA